MPPEDEYWVKPEDVLRASMVVNLRGSLEVNSIIYKRGNELKQFLGDLGLEYRETLNISTCQLFITDTPYIRDAKHMSAVKNQIPLMLKSDFSAWAANQQVHGHDFPLIELMTPMVATSRKHALVNPEALSAMHLSSDIEERWVSPDEFLTEGTRLTIRGSVVFNGQRYCRGAEIKQLCQRLGLRYLQKPDLGSYDVFITNDPEKRDRKYYHTLAYDIPFMKEDEFVHWAEVQLEK